MKTKPTLVFECAHLTVEGLFADQVDALRATHDCHVFAFRDHPTLGGMAVELLAHVPARFTLIGLSLGGYLAFEIIRRQRERIERLVLLDTRAVADTETVRQGGVFGILEGEGRGGDVPIPPPPAPAGDPPQPDPV